MALGDKASVKVWLKSLEKYRSCAQKELFTPVDPPSENLVKNYQLTRGNDKKYVRMCDIITSYPQEGPVSVSLMYLYQGEDYIPEII